MSEQIKVPTGTGTTDAVTGTESEPLRGRANYVTIAGLLVAAAVSYGIPMTDAQQATTASLLAIGISIAAPQVVAWWARRHVNSPATMRKILTRGH